MYETIEQEAVLSTYKKLEIKVNTSEYFKFYDKKDSLYKDSITIIKDWSDLSVQDGNINTKIELKDSYDIIFDAPVSEETPTE